MSRTPAAIPSIDAVRDLMLEVKELPGVMDCGVVYEAHYPPNMTCTATITMMTATGVIRPFYGYGSTNERALRNALRRARLFYGRCETCETDFSIDKAAVIDEGCPSRSLCQRCHLKRCEENEKQRQQPCLFGDD